MTNEILTAARLLSTPGQVIEVRAITEDGVASGYFDSPEKLAKNVDPINGLPTVHGIYVTLNPVDPALFSRRANRIKMRLGKKDATTADSDIVCRHWLPIDIDPVRPSGVSSTNEEHDAAIATARRVAAFLAETGFPAPILADSGNGAHLLYSIDLPNDDASRVLVKRCLEVLDTLFSDGQATIDTANFNAGRIWKLYGTMSRKGDNTADRPHRRSTIIDAPLVSAIVDRDILERLTRALPNAPPVDDAGNQSRGHKIVLRQWLSDHGIGVNAEKPYEGGTLYQLEECPFSAAHKDGAYAIQFPNGAVYAGCHHDTCDSGKQKWQELRERYEPVRERKQPAQKMASPPRVPPGVPPVPASADLPCRDEALEVLQHGDPLALMLDAFAQEHTGDEILARCLILSMASQAVKNSAGLHVSVTGESGKGKTHAFGKMLRQVPERYKVKGTVSNKALYYMRDLSPRTVLMSDDTELSDAIQEILKSATSNFDEPIAHNTVTKDFVPRVCTIPERCVWWIAKKEGTGDDQVMNRMLTCWIDESPEQDKQVLKAKQKKEQLDPDTIVDESPELITCRAIWEILHEQQIWVIIPYSERIHFRSISNRRNPDMLYDLIKSHAVLYFMQRETKTTKDGTLCVYANEADFSAANDVFTLLNGTAGGQESKMTKKESDLLGTINRASHEEFTIRDLQRLTGWSYSSIYRTIKGYECRGKNYTGLLEKCPALSFTDRTETISEEQGNSVRHRTEAFQWDKELYRQWSCSSGCWLDHDPNAGNGSFAALQHVFSSFSATAANENGAQIASDSSKGTDYNDNLLLREGHLQQNQNYAGTDRAVPGTHQYPCKSENAANEIQSLPDTAQSVNAPPHCVPIVSSTCCKHAEMVLQTTPSAAKHDRTIRAHDYKPLDIPEPHASCFSCGKKGSWYVEKLTAERRARPKDDQAARRVCRKCYDAAVRRDRAAAPPLPGVIDLSDMERHAANIGKCSVCNLGSATYFNKETGVKICEQCHTREVQRQCHKTGVPV
ncbi:MAG: hypothetical protein NTZ39_09280 [Methanoregula sp.]|nr:hypothetical protein [Methanoregula sp.]